MKYTMTNDTITVITDDGPLTIRKGAPNFLPLREALFGEDEEKVMNLLTVKDALAEWSSGDFTIKDETIFYGDDAIPEGLSKRIMAMVTENADPACLLRFWERLSDNPSWRSTQQLFRFLDHEGIPIQENGTFLAYKSVRPNLMDHHTGTIKNSVDSVHEMPRNKISDDPNTACHYGFHVGALEYAKSFGGSGSRIVICEVDPAHVVCVPYDSSSQKVRVCEYKVVGFYSGKLPSTTMKEETEPKPPKTKAKSSKANRPKDWGSLSPDHLNTLEKMSATDLIGLHIVTLRRYASYLKVVRAYRIPGGKAALVKAILQARG